MQSERVLPPEMNINSNCSRIDAVKASANQLQQQVALAPPSTRETPTYKKTENQVQDLETQIKTGNAQKAENALAAAASAVKQLQTPPPSQPLLDTYA